MRPKPIIAIMDTNKNVIRDRGKLKKFIRNYSLYKSGDRTIHDSHVYNECPNEVCRMITFKYLYRKELSKY